MLLSGAAPLPRHVEEFLRIIPASNLSQGYGKSRPKPIFEKPIFWFGLNRL